MPINMPKRTSLAMELLCLLSPRPRLIESLADDLGLPNDAAVIALARRLKEKGYDVRLGDFRGYDATQASRAECAWVSLHAWPMVRSAAQRWWNRTRQDD